MSWRLHRLVAVAVLAMACAVSVSSVALGSQRAQPKLRVSSGSMRLGVIKATDKPALITSFTIINAGKLLATRLSAWVEIATSGGVVIHRYAAGPLRAGHHITLRAQAPLTERLLKSSWKVEGCVLLGSRILLRSPARSCKAIGSYGGEITGTPTVVGTPTTTTGTPTTTTTTTTSTPTTPASTVPGQPLTGYSTNSPYFVADGRGQYEGQVNAAGTAASPAYDDYSGGFYTSGYWAVVPPSYDETNQTPETLVVWLHGCYGVAAWDAQDLTGQYNSDRPYILISVNGPEDAGQGNGPDCWDTTDQTDVQQVLADITNAETHFNIDRRRVIIAGYSSGGDLAYQTIFLHADTFAGILALNTDPVDSNTFHNAAAADDGLSTAVAASAWKFPIVQVAHNQDATYPPSLVTPHMQQLQSDGFPVSYSILTGTHYDDDVPAGCNDTTPGTCTGGTAYDIVHSLLSTIATDGWEAPAS